MNFKEKVEKTRLIGSLLGRRCKSKIQTKISRIHLAKFAPQHSIKLELSKSARQRLQRGHPNGSKRPPVDRTIDIVSSSST